jgi:hypothetical protein
VLAEFLNGLSTAQARVTWSSELPGRRSKRTILELSSWPSGAQYGLCWGPDRRLCWNLIFACGGSQFLCTYCFIHFVSISSIPCSLAHDLYRASVSLRTFWTCHPGTDVPLMPMSKHGCELSCPWGWHLFFDSRSSSNSKSSLLVDASITYARTTSLSIFPVFVWVRLARKYGTSLIPKVGRRSDRSQTLLIIMWGTNKVQSLSASSPSCYDGAFNLPYVYSSPASFIRR